MNKTVLTVIALLSIIHTGAQQMNLSLEQCRDMALKNSEDMKISRYQVEKAKTDKQIAQTAYLPKFSASGMYAYMHGDFSFGLPDMDMPVPIHIHTPDGGTMNIIDDMGAMIPKKINTDINTGMYLIGAALQQPVYAGGKIITANKMAGKVRELTEENAGMTRMNVVADAEKAYWMYYSVMDKINLLKQYEILLDTLYRSVSVMIAVKMATENELLKITSRKSNIQYRMQKAKNGMELSRIQLCRMIGVDMDTEIILTDSISIAISPAVNLQGVHVSEDLTIRPEYRMLQKQVELQELNIKNIRGDYLPTIGLMAGYSYLGDMKFDNISVRMNKPMPLVMLSVGIPIFHFGEGNRKIQSARIALNMQQEELNKTGKLLAIEIQHARRNLQDAHLLITLSETAFEEAAASLKQIRDHYETGMATLLDVLDAQAQWQEACSNIIDARVQYKISELEYLRVCGAL